MSLPESSLFDFFGVQLGSDSAERSIPNLESTVNSPNGMEPGYSKTTAVIQNAQLFNSEIRFLMEDILDCLSKENDLDSSVTKSRSFSDF